MRRDEERDSRSDLLECKERIKRILREYNCEISSTYDYSTLYIRDRDNDERVGLDENDDF